MADRFSTFHSWLLGNYPADESSLGFVAGDLREDEEFPTSADDWDTIKDYLVGTGTNEGDIALLARAWRQYLDERAEVEAAELADLPQPAA